MSLRIINFADNDGEFFDVRLKDNPERLIEGDPRHQTTVHFSNSEANVVAGTWTATPGKFKVAAERDEFCYIVSGEAELVDQDGHGITFVTGDAFIIPNGFDGHWNVIDTTTKHFMIYKYDA